MDEDAETERSLVGPGNRTHVPRPQLEAANEGVETADMLAWQQSEDPNGPSMFGTWHARPEGLYGAGASASLG